MAFFWQTQKSLKQGYVWIKVKKNSNIDNAGKQILQNNNYLAKYTSKKKTPYAPGRDEKEKQNMLQAKLAMETKIATKFPNDYGLGFKTFTNIF